MTDEQRALEIAVNLIELKLSEIDKLPEEERTLLNKLVVKLSALPNRYKTGSSVPYFKEKYAQQIKVVVDKIAADPEHKSLLIDALSLNTQKSSLQQRVFQSLLYLEQRLDPDGKYAELRKNFSVKKHPRGIIIEWKRDSLLTESIGTPIEQPTWREQLETFIESSVQGATLDIPLEADEEEMEELRQTLADVADKFVPLCISNKRLVVQNNEHLARYAKGRE